MITITWPDGKTTTASGWTELERAVRAEQWDAYGSRREFRQDMRRRAEVWSGSRIPATILMRASRGFLLTLAKYGAFEIEQGER